MVVVLAASAIALFGTLLFLRFTFGCLRRGRLVRAGAHSIICLACGGVLALGGTLLLSLLAYDRLTSERPIATVRFNEVADSEFEARIAVEGETARSFLLTGDEWQMDARIVTFTPPATILGLEPIFRLERLSGRYTDIISERERPRTVHALSDPPLIDIWNVAREAPALLPGIDAYYGTATYLPMSDGAVFEVSLSRDALIARPANAEAVEAVGNWR